jgi:hypothetical protein
MAELPEEIRQVFEGFGYGCLAAETNIGVVHICHAADGIPLQISASGGYLPRPAQLAITPTVCPQPHGICPQLSAVGGELPRPAKLAITSAVCPQPHGTCPQLSAVGGELPRPAKLARPPLR